MGLKVNDVILEKVYEDKKQYEKENGGEEEYKEYLRYFLQYIDEDGQYIEVYRRNPRLDRIEFSKYNRCPRLEAEFSKYNEEDTRKLSFAERMDTGKFTYLHLILTLSLGVVFGSVFTGVILYGVMMTSM